jgi:hypothetical protein
MKIGLSRRSSTSRARSGIFVHDHIIAGKNGHAGLKGMLLI